MGAVAAAVTSSPGDSVAPAGELAAVSDGARDGNGRAAPVPERVQPMVRAMAMVATSAPTTGCKGPRERRAATGSPRTSATASATTAVVRYAHPIQTTTA